MWLTPAGSRPYISGTDDNSIWSLILGYNGLGRLFGQDGGPGGGMGGGAGGVFGGSTGPLRLLNEALGGQAGWFLGFAAVAAIALAVLTRLRRTDPRTGFLIIAGAAFAVTAITFSRASGIFHPYYVAALAPFTALLVGAGCSLLTRERIAGPLILAGGATHRSDRDRQQRDRPRLGELADRRRDPGLRRRPRRRRRPARPQGRRDREPSPCCCWPRRRGPCRRSGTRRARRSRPAARPRPRRWAAAEARAAAVVRRRRDGRTAWRHAADRRRQRADAAHL